MSNVYEIAWNAFGIAVVEADSEKEAQDMVLDGCFDFDNIEFERNDVDGVDVNPA